MVCVSEVIVLDSKHLRIALRSQTKNSLSLSKRRKGNIVIIHNNMVNYLELNITISSTILSTIIIRYAIPLSNPVKPIKTQYINLLILYIEGVLLLHYSLKILNAFFNISLLYAINPTSLE